MVRVHRSRPEPAPVNDVVPAHTRVGQRASDVDRWSRPPVTHGVSRERAHEVAMKTTTERWPRSRMRPTRHGPPEKTGGCVAATEIRWPGARHGAIDPRRSRPCARAGPAGAAKDLTDSVGAVCAARPYWRDQNSPHGGRRRRHAGSASPSLTGPRTRAHRTTPHDCGPMRVRGPSVMDL